MFRDGVPEEDQRRLFQHARLSLAEQDAVKNLTRLGVRMNRVSIRFDSNHVYPFPQHEIQSLTQLYFLLPGAPRLDSVRPGWPLSTSWQRACCNFLIRLT